MADFDDDSGFSLYEDANYWWRRKRSRERIREMVGTAVSNELARSHAMQSDSQARFKAQWDKTNALFDPPTDDASMSERLHLPYSKREPEPVYQTMADDTEGDDGPPQQEPAHGGR